MQNTHAHTIKNKQLGQTRSKPLSFKPKANQSVSSQNDIRFASPTSHFLDIPQTENNKNKHAQWQAHTHIHTHTDTQTHRHTDTQTHRHTDTQTHKRTDTHTHSHIHTDTHTHTYTLLKQMQDNAPKGRHRLGTRSICLQRCALAQGPGNYAPPNLPEWWEQAQPCPLPPEKERANSGNAGTEHHPCALTNVGIRYANQGWFLCDEIHHIDGVL